MMTVATVERLIHHATLIEISSDSYRRKQALQQRADGNAPGLCDNYGGRIARAILNRLR